MQRDWGSSRVSCTCQLLATSASWVAYGDPQDAVRVDGVAGATNVLLVTGRVDDNGVLRGACVHQRPSAPVSSVWRRTETAGVEGPHVEDVDALHLSENLKTLETGRLLGVGGDGSGLRTLGDKVVHGLDLWCASAIGRVSRTCAVGVIGARCKKLRARHVRSSFL